MPPQRWIAPYWSLLPSAITGSSAGSDSRSGGERGLEVVERLQRRRVDPRGVELLLVGEDADGLAGLGDAVQVALAERRALVAPRELLERLRRERLLPAVGLGVLVERQDQARLDELAVELVALVAGEDVRRVVARRGEPRLLDPAREVAELDVDGDVRVLGLELARELLDRVARATRALGRDDLERDVAEVLEAVGLDLLRRGVGALVGLGCILPRGAAACRDRHRQRGRQGCVQPSSPHCRPPYR